jgi:hypothetical protein
MSRITGTDAANLIEAYNAVYTHQEEIEQIDEIAVPPRDPAAAKSQSSSAAQTFRNIGNVVRTITNPMGATISGMQRATKDYQASGPRDVKGRPLSSPRPATATTSPSAEPYRSRFAGARDSAFARAQQIKGSPVVGPKTTASAPPTKPAVTTPARPTSTTPTKPATSTTAPAPKPLGFTPRTLTSAELKAATAARAAARSAGKSAADVEKDAIAAVSKLQKSSFDIFDVIKGHLLDEGYADTEEAALAIMANMSESWKKSIIEG